MKFGVSFLRPAGCFAIFLAAMLVIESDLPAKSDSRKNREKRMNCENRCKNTYWRCRAQAANGHDKKSERRLIICGSTFQSCNNRCQVYRDK